MLAMPGRNILKHDRYGLPHTLSDLMNHDLSFAKCLSTRHDKVSFCTSALFEYALFLNSTYLLIDLVMCGYAQEIIAYSVYHFLLVAGASGSGTCLACLAGTYSTAVGNHLRNLIHFIFIRFSSQEDYRFLDKQTGFRIILYD